jgi:hypothetical protein
MSSTSEAVLTSFEQLSENEKQTVATEILRRTLTQETPSIEDEDLVHQAEALFLHLDEAESSNE